MPGTLRLQVKRLLPWLLLAAACSRSREGLLLLEIERAPDVPPLTRIAVQAGGRTAEWPGDVPFHVGLYLTASSSVAVVVDGYAEQGVVAQASDSIALAAGETRMLHLRLERSSTPAGDAAPNVTTDGPVADASVDTMPPDASPDRPPPSTDGLPPTADAAADRAPLPPDLPAASDVPPPDAACQPCRELLVYEPFDYALGPLDLVPGHTNAGGFGWRFGWVGNGPTVSAMSLPAMSGGRTLASAGRSLLLPKESDGAAVRLVDISAVPAALRDNDTAVGRAGATLWLSFVAQVTEPQLQTKWQTAGVWLDMGSAGKRFVGFPGYGPGGYETKWGISHTMETLYSAVPITSRALLVVSFLFGPNARTRLWVDPPLGADAPLGAPDTELHGVDFRFDRIRVVAQNGAGEYIDELRLGASYASVTPPAP